MGNITELNAGSWADEVEKKSGIVIVDFWAPWCGPCKMLSPIIEELSGEYQEKVKFSKINTDDFPEIAGKYQVRGIPTLIFFKDGQEIERTVGVNTKTQLKTKIDKISAA